MNDEPIDFSPLDPSRDARRWQARIDGIVAETMRARQRRLGLMSQLLSFAKPALAIAAALALVSWAGAMQYRSQPSVRASAHPATNLLEWAANDQVPSANEVFESLGVQHDGR